MPLPRTVGIASINVSEFLPSTAKIYFECENNKLFFVFHSFGINFVVEKTNNCMELNFSGILIGVVTFIVIGLFHPLVIKAEYYIGVRSWWLFLLLGIASGISSLLVSDLTLSIILGVVAFSSFWSIGEVFEQKKRVEKGWFPANPKKKRE